MLTFLVAMSAQACVSTTRPVVYTTIYKPYAMLWEQEGIGSKKVTAFSTVWHALFVYIRYILVILNLFQRLQTRQQWCMVN